MKPNRLSSLTLSCLATIVLSGRANAQEPVLISLARAIEMALENNLDIVVSRLDTQFQAEGVASARGVYQPVLLASFNNRDSRSPAQTQLEGAQTLSSTRANYDFTWQQELSTGGRYKRRLAECAFDDQQCLCGVQPSLRCGGERAD